MESSSQPTLHILLIPLMAQGHMIPTVDFGRCLAERGYHVSLVTTPINAIRLQPTADRIQSSGLSFKLVTLRFPCSEVGLPEGCENADLIPTADMLKKYFDAIALLEEPFREYVREQTVSGPTCIVSDWCLPWTRHVSREFGIPRYVFYSVCCFSLFCHEILPGVYEKEGIGELDDDRAVVVPELLQKIEVTRAQAPGFLSGSPELRREIELAESTSDGIIVNTFSEMESYYVEKYSESKNKKIWTVGPVSLINKEISDKSARGSKSSIDPNTILSWLDPMNPKSVIYMNLGSLARTPPKQAMEIAMGLESSGHPFIWVIQSRDKMAEVEEWIRTSEFEERNKTRCLVIRGWAPQVMLLSHPSVGGFVTHCGWNSSVEGITSGLPLITWPFFCDQFLNERFVVDVLGIGVPIGVKDPNWWWDEVVMVKRERLTEVVKILMDSGKEAEDRRRRAFQVGEMAKRAMEVGGSSYDNISSFIVEAIGLVHKESFEH